MKKSLPYLFGIIALSVVVAAFFLGALLSDKKAKAEKKSAYNTVIELWQIDLFEGGTGSRQNYLLKQAKAFEKENPKVLISVSVRTAKGVEESLKKGELPDMISFSCGIEGLSPILNELKVNAKQMGASVNGKCYAVPWAYGGYFYISKGEERITKTFVSQGEYTLPYAALMLSGKEVTSPEVKKPLEAYAEFVSTKNAALVGTQRDLYRLAKRSISFTAEPLEGFTDLIQYIGITAEKGENYRLCHSFIEKLVASDEELYKIGMLSPNGAVPPSGEQIFSLYNVEFSKTVSVFTSPQALKEAQNFLMDNTKSQNEKNDYLNIILKSLK